MGSERQLRRARAYFNEHLDELLKKFPGEYIAIIEQEVVFHHSDLGNLTRKVYREYKQRPIFIEKVEPPQEIALPALN